MSCQSCVYIPIIHSSGERGIAEEMFSGIVVGKTTKEDVLLTFGCPSRHHDSADGSTFEYYWKITRGYIGVCIGSMNSQGGAVGVVSPVSYRTLRIWFDCTDTVRSYHLSKKLDTEKIVGYSN